MSKLKIENIHASIAGKEIIKGFSFTFDSNKTYALVGPNGHGKSTLFSAIMGDPNIELTSGEMYLDETPITYINVDERVKLGLGIVMQSPPSIPGVTNLTLLNTALSTKKGNPQLIFETYADMKVKLKKIRLQEEFIERDVNVGASGGEKKKTELLHTLVLKPTFAFLDEIDSGLDVDSIKSISEELVNQKLNTSFIVISHYLKMLDIIQPDELLIIKDGKLYKSGPYKELSGLIAQGFDHI